MMGRDRSQDLAELFADIARQMQAEADLARTRQRVTAAAVGTIEGCDHASISLVGQRGDITSEAATDRIPVLVDEIQHEVGEGPCLGALTDHEIYHCDDLATETRWPRFSRRAAERTGVASMLAFRLFVGRDTMGALNLYSRTVAAFDDDDRAVGAILAAHAAIAIVAARQDERSESLDAALHTSRRIGTAIGIVMCRRTVGEDEAFGLLRTTSQALNVKLRDVASTVVETGELPDLPVLRGRAGR